MNTRQQVFDHFWDHFFVKGNPFGYEPKYDQCFYAKNCAVGYRMSPSWCEKADQEELNFRSLPQKLRMEYYETVGMHPAYDFVTFMQSLHDEAASGDEDRAVQCLHILSQYVTLPPNAQSIVLERIKNEANNHNTRS